MKIFVLVKLIFLCLLCNYVMCKECTDWPTPAKLPLDMRNLLSTTSFDPIKAAIKMTELEQQARGSKWPLPVGILKEVDLHDVRLDPNSKHGTAQQTNLEYLLMLDINSLTWNFRKTAGVPNPPGKPYGGWEDPNEELRGHFVGHYLSATATMWASTGNGTIMNKMSALVDALSECQHKINTGYLGAFPTELFDRVETIQKVWAPYYTAHKLLAGLLDQHVFGKNPKALQMVKWMVEYFYKRVQKQIAMYSIEVHWASLNAEFGGMNDLLYQLYSITKDPKHLTLAHLFDKPCFLGILAMRANDIGDLHTNTHIPIVIGAQKRYEVTGDPLYREMPIFYMNIINSTYRYATGGISVDEHWRNPNRLGTTLGTENEESCTSYNQLKVARNLFRWTRDMSYADYYERTLTNGVLSIQRGREPGVMIYFFPQGRGVSKAVSSKPWGTPFGPFWCCYGSGIESFSKLGDSIYFEKPGKSRGLYIIQYISSTFNWSAAHIHINMSVSPPHSLDNRLQVTLAITSTKASKVTLYLRIPYWSVNPKGTHNGSPLNLPPPGHFLSVNKAWRSGDKITLELPMTLWTDPIKDDGIEYANVKAIFYGPYLLAGLSMGDWDIKTGPVKSLTDWIVPVPPKYNRHLISLSQQNGKQNLAISHANNSMTMEKWPLPGTNSSVHCTFRLILKGPERGQPTSSHRDAMGKSVLLEPFDLPGMVVVQKGANQTLEIAQAANAGNSAAFVVIGGNDGKIGSVSFEAKGMKGCFLSSDGNMGLKLSCGNAANVDFKHATSFILNNGIAKYNPVSFIAKGGARNYVLFPILSLWDENYTVYFNITQ